MVQINQQGQMTLPPELQEQLGLLSGPEVQLEVVGNVLQLRRKDTPSRGKQLIAALRGKATSQLTTAEMMDLSRGPERSPYCWFKFGSIGLKYP
jgi:antitoxin component of MazEF toxin-antitoxin module